MVRDGHHILPTLYLPEPGAQNKGPEYYRAAIEVAKTLQLPLTFKSTQWESLLLADTQASIVARECGSTWATVTAPRCLSPFASVDSWRGVGASWGGTRGLRELQAAYPDPPLIVFLSNNEAPRLPWPALDADPRYVELHGVTRGATYKQSVAAAAWSERYRALEEGFRNSLSAPAWTSHSIFVGYNAFAPGFVGRWRGWAARSLVSGSEAVPEADGWDGASVPFYVNIGDPSTDYTVYSPQIAAMTWVPMRRTVETRKANFWFELSTWDGAAPEDARSKPREYLRRGQKVDPPRYRGMVQFGMWLLRPRVVREYRGYLERRSKTEPYFAQILRAVDRIYANPTLEEFWRHGALVTNLSHEHPYDAALPASLASMHRWFLLDTILDQPRPWTLDTKVDVFAIALVLGNPGARRWLVYAHAPLGDRAAVTITIPDFRAVKLAVRVGGTFTLVDERSGAVREV